MNKLLERQIRRALGEKGELPPELAPFVAAIEQTYEEADRDRGLLERSLEITSQELLQRNEELRREIDELQSTRTKLSAANDQLQQLVGFRTTFLNTTAHELATPLTPLLLQSHLLQRRVDEFNDPQLKRSIEMMHRNLTRLNSLVQDVLDAARIQGGRLKLTAEVIDLGRLVNETVESFHPLAAQSDVRLEVQQEGDLMVAADPRRLGQVLFNLVSNAIKFTLPGGHVLVRADGSNHQVVICVTDTGVGMDPSQKGDLFQPFRQLTNGRPAKAGGTGLGLYVSRGIVEQHGGRIECESPGLGLGSTFTVTIPRMIPDEHEAAGAGK